MPPLVPVGIAEVDGVIEGVGIAVGADAGGGGAPPVGLEEPPEHGVAGAGVEVREPASASKRSPMKPSGSAGVSGLVTVSTCSP